MIHISKCFSGVVGLWNQIVMSFHHFPVSSPDHNPWPHVISLELLLQTRVGGAREKNTSTEDRHGTSPMVPTSKLTGAAQADVVEAVAGAALTSMPIIQRTRLLIQENIH